MLQKWESTLNTSGVTGAVLMDLSKAFDCLSHELLLAKLDAYGFGQNVLHLIHSYLTKRKHYTRIGSKKSTILEILLGVPQGSVLGPLLFNLFINDLILLCREDLCNFADDNTMYVCCETLSDVLNRINSELKVVLSWFADNGMVANPDKFQTIFLGTREPDITIEIGSKTIYSSKKVKLLGVTIDHQLTFLPHILTTCGKAMQKSKH